MHESKATTHMNDSTSLPSQVADHSKEFTLVILGHSRRRRIFNVILTIWCVKIYRVYFIYLFVTFCL